MYAGQDRRAGARRHELFAAPQHPYTWGLLRSMPRLDAPPATSPGADPRAAAERSITCRAAAASIRAARTCASGTARSTRRSSRCAGAPGAPGRVPAAGGGAAAIWTGCGGGLAARPPRPRGGRRHTTARRGPRPRQALPAHARGSSSSRRLGDGAGGRRRDASVREGETLGIVGETGCGKIDARAHPAEPARADERRRCAARGEDVTHARGAQLAAAAARAADGLPGPGRLAQPAQDGRRRRSRSPFAIHGLLPERRGARRGGCRSCWSRSAWTRSTDNRYPHELSGGQRQRVGDRARDRAGAGAARRRRAGLRARRLDPGADPQPAARPAARAGPDARADRARPRGRPAHVRPRRGDARRASSSRSRRWRSSTAHRARPTRASCWRRCRGSPDRRSDRAAGQRWRPSVLAVVLDVERLARQLLAARGEELDLEEVAAVGVGRDEREAVVDELALVDGEVGQLGGGERRRARPAARPRRASSSATAARRSPRQRPIDLLAEVDLPVGVVVGRLAR